MLALLREGLAGASRTTHVDEINGEMAAIGDLCLILIDQVEEALAHISERIAMD